MSNDGVLAGPPLDAHLYVADLEVHVEPVDVHEVGALHAPVHARAGVRRAAQVGAHAPERAVQRAAAGGGHDDEHARARVVGDQRQLRNGHLQGEDAGVAEAQVADGVVADARHVHVAQSDPVPLWPLGQGERQLRQAERLRGGNRYFRDTLCQPRPDVHEGLHVARV